MGYLLSSLYGRTEIFYIGCHSLLGDGFPRFFQQQDLAHALQPPHLGEEGFHNDDRHHGQQRAVFGDVIQLEDDEPLVQQIHLTVRVEQVVVLSAPVERFEDVQEVRPIEILLTNLLLLQQPSVVGGDELDTQITVSAVNDLTSQLFGRDNIRRKALEIKAAAAKEVNFTQELERLMQKGRLLKTENEGVRKLLMNNNPDDGLAGGPTLWKLTQAITAYAREAQPARQRELHELSGELLNRVNN